jgi:hypothetical protein
MVVPRVFMDDTPQDKAAVQQLIQGIDVYPLSMFDGKMKQRDWAKLQAFPSPASDKGSTESKWVFPEKFFASSPLRSRIA